MPAQVFIDGIAQLSSTSNESLKNPRKLQHPPKLPNFEKEAREAVKWEGLPPLTKGSRDIRKNAVFRNVSVVRTRGVGNIVERLVSDDSGIVIVTDGRITCIGTCELSQDQTATYKHIDLAGGVLAPGLISFGSPLGLEEIRGERTTRDGVVFDVLTPNSGDDIVKNLEWNIAKAMDGMQFETRDAL